MKNRGTLQHNAAIPLYYYRKMLLYNFSSFRVLSRCACMGLDVIRMIGWDRSCLNFQKSRVDYLLKLAENHRIKPKIGTVEKYLERKDILSLIYQQRHDFWRHKKPNLIILDSFSELTDQLFVHKKNRWCFLCNYNDVNHQKVFSSTFHCDGLLELDELPFYYKAFFTKLKKHYPNVPIVYLHFPTTLDVRPVFKNRGQLIFQYINEIADSHDNFFSFKIGDSVVLQNTCLNTDETFREFPYHFNNDVYQWYADQIKMAIQDHINI
ncbi:MAG: hypothetical protein KQH53_11690 [Desulfarculaceae bacterium]|nr:hypothetical protein [Desulfarculaceae bacterium]